MWHKHGYKETVHWKSNSSQSSLSSFSKCNTISYLPVSLPPAGGCVLWLVDLDEGGGANLPPGGGGRSPKPPELCGRDLSFFFDCWNIYTRRNRKCWFVGFSEFTKLRSMKTHFLVSHACRPKSVRDSLRGTALWEFPLRSAYLLI